MSKQRETDAVEVWLVEPGQGRPQFALNTKRIEFLPTDAPLPQAGDLVMLPRRVTGDTKTQTFAWGGSLAPFRVLELEHVYFRAKQERHDATKPKPARYVKSLVYVRRLTPEEYAADPGTGQAVSDE